MQRYVIVKNNIVHGVLWSSDADPAPFEPGASLVASAEAGPGDVHDPESGRFAPAPPDRRFAVFDRGGAFVAAYMAGCEATLALGPGQVALAHDMAGPGWTWSAEGGCAAPPPLPPPPPPLELAAYAAALRRRLEGGGMAVDEWRVGTSERDTVLAVLARRRADDDPAAIVAWLDADGVPWELQAADIVAITDRIVRRAHDLNAALAAARDAIAAGDVRSLADVELFFADFDTLDSGGPAAGVPPAAPPAVPPPGN